MLLLLLLSSYCCCHGVMPLCWHCHPVIAVIVILLSLLLCPYCYCGHVIVVIIVTCFHYAVAIIIGVVVIIIGVVTLLLLVSSHSCCHRYCCYCCYGFVTIVIMSSCHCYFHNIDVTLFICYHHVDFVILLGCIVLSLLSSCFNMVIVFCHNLYHPLHT